MELVHQYLHTLPPASVDELYRDHDVVYALIESLSALAQSCCFRMVCLGQRVVSRSQVLDWVGTAANGKRKLAHVLDDLIALRLVLRVGEGITVHSAAQDTLVQLLSQPRDSLEACAPGTSAENWERLLLFMASGSTVEWEPSEELINVMTRTGLFRRLPDAQSSDQSSSESSGTNDESIGVLTAEGFNFLLLPTQTQLWRFCLAYVAGCAQPEQVLAMLFWLCSGRAVPLSQLCTAQLAALPVLHQLGLVAPSEASELRGSWLAMQLRCNQSNATGGSVLVEQNFRLCVRGDSRLLVCLASLFGTVERQLPQLTVLSVTRQSVTQAVQRGVSPEQIVSFLKSHSPEECPLNLTDQIMLWGQEETRAAVEPAMCYDSFESQALYEQALAYSKAIEAHLWGDPSQRVLLLKAEAHEQVKRRVMQLKADAPETQELYD